MLHWNNMDEDSMLGISVLVSSSSATGSFQGSVPNDMFHFN